MLSTRALVGSPRTVSFRGSCVKAIGGGGQAPEGHLPAAAPQLFHATHFPASRKPAPGPGQQTLMMLHHTPNPLSTQCWVGPT